MDLRKRHTPARIAFARPWPTTLRGLILWLFSLAFITIGLVNYVLTPLPPLYEQALTFALAIAPTHVWGWTMVGAGVVAGYSSYCHKGRDLYGYVILAVFSTAWASGYLAGLIVFDAALRSLSGAVVWYLFAGILTAVAGVPNTPLLRRHRPGHREPW